MVKRQIKLPKLHSFFLFGPRGSGKSSLLRETFNGQNIQWVDLLNDELVHKYQLQPQLLRTEFEGLADKARPKWIVIDEVQKTPKLLNVVHQMIEAHKGLYFALTGSSSRRLKQKGTNLLAGRAFVEYLFPFTHYELGEKFDLTDVLSWGTLPKIFSLDDESKANYLRSYSLTYLKSEIQEEQWVRKVEPFRRFLPIAAQLSGQPLNYSKFARETGVDVTTIQTYYEILEDTLIGFHLPSYSKSIRKQQKKASKFYFFDVGVRRSLESKTTSKVEPRTSEFGNAFEQFIISEIYRLNMYAKKDFELSYLTTKSGVEIDLVLTRPHDKTALIEIKSADKIDLVELGSFIELSRDIPNSEAFVFSNDPIAKKIQHVWALPWREGLKKIGL